MDIIRIFPSKKNEDNYKRRYDKIGFEKYNEIMKNPENYEKWKLGINHKTNRKIKIGGKTHREIEWINFYISNGDGHYRYSIEELIGVDCDIYLQETERIKNEIQEYNNKIDTIISKIKLLEKWNDYIVFDEKKYGISFVYNNIHRENDCFGDIIDNGHTPCTCSTCENWNGCGSSGYDCFICKKCGYKYSSNLGYNSKNHKGK